MVDGIISVIIFCCGLFIGLRMEYKKDNKKSVYINPIKDEEQNTELNPNELTSEIIDEWMNGSDE